MSKRKDAYETWVADGEEKDKLAIITSLSMQGSSIAEIANAVGLSERQFHTIKSRHAAVSSALKKGRQTVVAMCQNKLMQKVNEGDTTAIIYALRVYGGDFFKKDRGVIKAEIGGRDGNAIEFQQTQVHVYLPEKEE